MNGKNQYRCHFCNKICGNPRNDRCKEFGKYARWQSCWNCEVSYAIGPKISLKAIKLWKHDPNEPKNFYQMLIDYKHKNTIISYFPKYVYPAYYEYPNYPFRGQEYRYQKLLDLSKPLNNITPNNLLEKIKMYLLFS
jgi:hypothetical protein